MGVGTRALFAALRAAWIRARVNPDRCAALRALLHSDFKGLRFGRELSDRIPDARTIWMFRGGTKDGRRGCVTFPFFCKIAGGMKGDPSERHAVDFRGCRLNLLRVHWSAKHGP